MSSSPAERASVERHVYGEPAMKEMRRSISVGAAVVGANGRKIGKVKAVHDDYVVVQAGLLTHHDLFVPVDALAGAYGDTVELKVAASEVAGQGWQYPPGAHFEHGEVAAPEVPQTTIIQTAGYGAGDLSAPEAQGFALDMDDEDDVLANRALDPDASEALDNDPA